MERTTMPDSLQKPRRGRPRGWSDSTEQATIKSLDRALVVLQQLGAYQGVTLSELAAEMSQSPATLYRVLTTLEGRGFAELDADSQLWHVGPGAFLAGAPFLRRSSLVERARPLMRQLMERTGETANLGIARTGAQSGAQANAQASARGGVMGDHVMFVSQVETHASIRAFFPPGTLSPLHASGIGKALLAAWPAAALDAYLARSERERFTDATLVAEADLRADLDATRARGYAIDAEEKAVGMRCIAAAVFDVHGEAVAGLSVSGPVARMSDVRLGDIGGAVRDAALALSEAAGGGAARV
jgi:IclR family acetate operon transcriptional repressor